MVDNKGLEPIDVLDEEGNKTGEVQTLEEIHKTGEWHDIAHVWVVNSDNKLLLQKRSPHIRVSPNKWGSSAGGHVSSGETILEGAQKESQEEIGLVFDISELEYIDTFKASRVFSDDKIFARHIIHVHIIKKNILISDFDFNDDEVSEVRYANLDEIEEMITEKPEETFMHREEYKILKKFLK